MSKIIFEMNHRTYLIHCRRRYRAAVAATFGFPIGEFDYTKFWTIFPKQTKTGSNSVTSRNGFSEIEQLNTVVNSRWWNRHLRTDWALVACWLRLDLWQWRWQWSSWIFIALPLLSLRYFVASATYDDPWESSMNLAIFSFLLCTSAAVLWFSDGGWAGDGKVFCGKPPSR